MLAWRFQAPSEKERLMARLPSITSKEQSPAKDHAVFEAIVARRGAVHGPFTMFLHSPEVSGRVAHLGAYVRFEGSLDMRVRVLAAMTGGREFEAGAVWGGWRGGCRGRGAPAAMSRLVCGGPRGRAAPAGSTFRRRRSPRSARTIRAAS